MPEYSNLTVIIRSRTTSSTATRTASSAFSSKLETRPYIINHLFIPSSIDLGSIDTHRDHLPDKIRLIIQQQNSSLERARSKPHSSSKAS